VNYRHIDVFDFHAGAELPLVPAPFLLGDSSQNGLIHRSQTLVYGMTDTGKSMLAMSCGVAVASGRPWLGLPVSEPGRVVWVSGDPDGKNEAVERLDKVRGDLGNGHIHIVVPQRPASQEAWVEMSQAADGASLMILDNLTQFVPSSLNDDQGVRLVYDELQKINQLGTAVCVIAHTSDKRNQFGHTSSVPLGTSIIRTVPRWFVHVRRSSKGVSLSMSGNGGRPWEMTVTEPTDAPRFEIVEHVPADELAARRRQRGKKALDENALIAQWCKEHPGLSQAEAAKRMTPDLGFKVTQSRVSRALSGLSQAKESA
jgi:hypothetical protein